MSRDDRDELSLEDLEAVNGGNFFDDVLDFSKGVWEKVRNTIIKSAH